jgi:formylglycine-generating enzyme required for sulfatase activity
MIGQFMRMVTALAWLALAGIALAADHAPARHALLIVNSRYASLPALTDAGEAARSLSEALKGAGFEVTYKEDAGYGELIRAAPEFLQQVQPGDVALFYFAGYSAFLEDDDNYLLPVDFAPSATADMQDRALRLKVLQRAFDTRDSAGLKLYVIDAARRIDAPLAAVNGNVPASGLMDPEVDPAQSPETLFLLPAPARRTVNNASGLLTRALADELRKPESKLRDMVARVKRDVFASSSGNQAVAVIDATLSEFSIGEPAPPPRLTVAKPEGRQPGDVAQSSIDGNSYVWIPAGKFQMGCAPSDKDCAANEKPRHEVSITHGFWLGQTEVNVLAYSKFVASFKPVVVGGQRIKSHQRQHMPHAPAYDPQWLQSLNPIVNVNWEDATHYCGWARGRLPTEAEWEYAARAGAADAIRIPAADAAQPMLGSLVNPDTGRSVPVQRVRETPQNAWNLYGMSGNVWEWIFDFYEPDFYEGSPASDPRGPASASDHVVRGGADARLSARRGQSGSAENTGIRCVMEDNAQTKALLGVH